MSVALVPRVGRCLREPVEVRSTPMRSLELSEEVVSRHRTSEVVALPEPDTHVGDDLRMVRRLDSFRDER